MILKYLQAVFFLLITAQITHSQSLRDARWILGYTNTSGSGPSEGYFGGMDLVFGADSLQINLIDIYCNTPTGVGNNEAGELDFYTSGCVIYNRLHQPMENGTDINEGEWHFGCDDPYHLGAGLRSATAVLPIPNSNRYATLYLRGINENNQSVRIDQFSLSEVDMDANEGLGRVTQKNIPVIENDSLVDAVVAVRHGNGRDWWVVVPRGVNRSFWTVRVDPEGVQPPQLQVLPPPYTPFTDSLLREIETPPYFTWELQNEYVSEIGGAQANFSPDGRLYARAVVDQEVEVYSFDRCTGALTLRKLIPMPYPVFLEPDTLYSTTLTYTAGLAFSPNSKYLYFNQSDGLFQVDVSEDSIETSQPLLVGAYDGYLEDGFFPALFFQMRNAPDGKIYMGCGNGTRVVHVIESPDSAGLACNFRPQGLALPRWHAWVFNYFPNFNLGPVTGSPCDSLTVSSGAPNRPAESLTIWPNPASGLVHIQTASDQAPLTGVLYDLTGRPIRRFETPQATNSELDLSDLPSGIYQIRLADDLGRVWIGKITVARD